MLHFLTEMPNIYMLQTPEPLTNYRNTGIAMQKADSAHHVCIHQLLCYLTFVKLVSHIPGDFNPTVGVLTFPQCLVECDSVQKHGIVEERTVLVTLLKLKISLQRNPTGFYKDTNFHTAFGTIHV